MFRRARIRLTALYIALFALVLGAFSLVFYVGFATVLAPSFDIGPDLSSEQIAEGAYQATLERIGLALVAGDLLVVALVGAVAWVLAARTLRPIREAHARQRRFVADASHEMRTPLAAIRASAEGALASADSTAELRGALKIVAISADGLGRITNDLLLLARSEEPRVEPPKRIDLSVVTAEAVEAFGAAHPELPPPRLSLAADVPIAADPSEIARIVANLLDNAIRYSDDPRRPPRIATRGSEREAILEVSDDGPGIAAADLDRIFEPFYRVRADSGTPAGSGLGLAIARSLAERNGGRLTAISEPGRGATFRLVVPSFK
jgi:signal transduction histidine kinase